MAGHEGQRSADGAEPFDPKISDCWRAEDIGVQADVENLPAETKDAQAPADTVSAGSITQPEAQPASTTTRSNSMFRNIVIAALVAAVGYLGYDKYQMDQTNQEVQKRLEGLTTWYVDSQFGSPAALEGKTCLEVTPQMQELGIERFVSIAERLPYADAATVKELLHGNVDRVAQAWNLTPYNNRAIVCLQDRDQNRSVLIHVHPASIGVYAYAAKKPYSDGKVWDHMFVYRASYSFGEENNRLISSAANMPALKREELAKLGDMNIVEKYDAERVLFLVGKYGVGEQFVHLSDEDYNVLAPGRNKYADGLLTELESVNYSWWRNDVKNYAKKMEREGTAKK